MTKQGIRRLGTQCLTAVAGLTLLLTGCGTASPSGTAASSTGAAEVNPAGDIPDDQVFVPYAPDSGLFTVSVPEGWARTDDNGAVTFTDKLNSVRIETVATPTAPDIASATAAEVPQISSSVTAYTAGDVSMVTRTAGDAVLITYGDQSEPDPVTGQTFTDSVERYEFWKNGQEVILTLSGPQGADNVDPWKTITDSFGWTP